MSEIRIYRTEGLPMEVSEVLRYAGVPPKEATAALADTALSTALYNCLSLLPKERGGSVCYRIFSLTHDDNCLDLGFTKTASLDLQRHLRGCQYALVFVATVGFVYDRLIRAYTAISPLKTLLLQAIGAQQVEALCDRFLAEQANPFAAMGYELLPRYSPGYGDLPLTVQKDLLPALDAAGQIGVTLSDSLLMLPQKSVSAIVGLRPRSISSTSTT